MENYENVKFYLSIKIFHQYIFHLPSFSLWAATFLLPWFGKWHTLTNYQNCGQPPYAIASKPGKNLRDLHVTDDKDKAADE